MESGAEIDPLKPSAMQAEHGVGITYAQSSLPILPRVRSSVLSVPALIGTVWFTTASVDGVPAGAVVEADSSFWTGFVDSSFSARRSCLLEP